MTPSPRSRAWFWIDNTIIDHYAPRLGALSVALYCLLARQAEAGPWTVPRPPGEQLWDFAPEVLARALARLEGAGLVRCTAGLVELLPVPPPPAPSQAPARSDPLRWETPDPVLAACGICNSAGYLSVTAADGSWGTARCSHDRARIEATCRAQGCTVQMARTGEMIRGDTPPGEVHDGPP